MTPAQVGRVTAWVLRVLLLAYPRTFRHAFGRDVLDHVTRAGTEGPEIKAVIQTASEGCPSTIGARLVGVSGALRRDPLTFAATALVVTLIALVACWLPARGARRTDPLAVTRGD